ncbi:MAG TPA: HAMP domain-containing protein [Planctomycetota bacterium]|nr:HAMP domain-containing protein [Planctomycetota bacterium]
MRVPLYAKVMVSYLIVVGLVVVPTLIYLKIGLQNELRGVVRKDLEDQLAILCARLERMPPDKLGPEADAIVDRLPQRVTVIDPEGNVLADSVLHEPDSRASRLENHSDRPEFKEALAKGAGSTTRTSATTGDTFLYVAMRFPSEGKPRGVVRLAMKTKDIDAAGVKVLSFLNQSGAVALSAAVILSLIAALVVSRPLRRIAQAARAFAGGDFGYSIGVKSNDELGAVGQALGEMVAQIRGRLVEAGADKMTLRALLDELPVGVILFDPSGEPTALNGKARLACGLTPVDERERAREIALLPPQAAARERVARTKITEDLSLELPWRKGSALRARWVATAASSGAAQLALIILEGSEVPTERPRARDVEIVRVSELCAKAREAVLATAGASSPEIALELGEEGVQVADAKGVGANAVRRLLAAGAAEVGKGGRLLLRGQVQPLRVRLSLVVPKEGFALDTAGPALRALGGDDGVTAQAGATEAWVALPRA